jgi:hypothetical protein
MEAAGVTCRLPVASTVPIPPSIVILVASVELHFSVEACPLVIVEGEASKEIVGAGADGLEGAGAAGGADGVTVATFFLAHPDAATTRPARRRINIVNVQLDFLMNQDLLL